MCNVIHVCIYVYHTAHIDIQYYDRGLSLCPASPMLPVLALFHPLASSTFMTWQGDWGGVLGRVGGLGGGERSKWRSYACVQLHKTKQAHALHTYSYTYEYSYMYTYSHTYVFTCMCGSCEIPCWGLRLGLGSRVRVRVRCPISVAIRKPAPAPNPHGHPALPHFFPPWKQYGVSYTSVAQGFWTQKGIWPRARDH